jgi:hypothetical protein
MRTLILLSNNSVRTSQETHYVFVTEPNRLITFRASVAVYCENRMEHRDTLCEQNAVRTSQETHYVSATEPNRLMLFEETATVYCENRMEHTGTLCGRNTNFYCVTAGGTYSNRCALTG